MINVHLHKTIVEAIPTFKIGVIQYHDIVIGDSPQMLRGRLQFFQETLKVELESKALTDYAGILEWRQIFKALNMDPNRYRPSHEALYRRIKKGDPLPLVHSAVDLNTFFSLQYVIPFGIYDLSTIQGDVILRLGEENESYEGVNGRINDMHGKLMSADHEGPFGSPIVDSIRTKVTQETTSALHLLYLQPSIDYTEAEQLVKAVASMFMQVHGGDYRHSIVTP